MLFHWFYPRQAVRHPLFLRTEFHSSRSNNILNHSADEHETSGLHIIFSRVVILYDCDLWGVVRVSISPKMDSQSTGFTSSLTTPCIIRVPDYLQPKLPLSRTANHFRQSGRILWAYTTLSRTSIAQPFCWDILGSCCGNLTTLPPPQF